MGKGREENGREWRKWRGREKGKGRGCLLFIYVILATGLSTDDRCTYEHHVVIPAAVSPGLHLPELTRVGEEH